MRLPGVILAAGLSSRMGQAKALLPLDDSTFLNRLIETFLSVCRPVIVVLGKDTELIAPTLPQNPHLLFVINEDYEWGMLSSLQKGLRALPRDSTGVVFTLVDHPRLRVETLQTVVNAFLETNVPVVIPRYQGKRGHPVAISAAVAKELLQTPATESPKDTIRAHRDASCFLDLDDPSIVEDIDTPEDFRQLIDLEGS